MSAHIPPFIGIDFGTTKCKMAWFNHKTGQAEALKNEEGEEKTPSVVYYGKDEILVGKPAEDLLEEIGEDQDEEFERVIRSVKRRLKTQESLALPGGKRISPLKVVEDIFSKLKRDAEKLHFQEKVDRAVITCPALFNDKERKAIESAAMAAGFISVELLEEPQAAALAFGNLGQKVGRGILVYDLGGGTFDLAFVVREDDGSYRVALETDGDPRCGGDDFDQALYSHWDKEVRERYGRPISRTEGKNDPRFLRECCRRKENLGIRDRHKFSSTLSGGVKFEVRIDRSTFECLIRDAVDKTVRQTKTMFHKAQARGYEVETVVLIGGSSRIPLIEKSLSESLAMSPLKWQYQDLAVALGAAYHGRHLWDAPKDPPRRTKETPPETAAPTPPREADPKADAKRQYHEAIEIAGADKMPQKERRDLLEARASELHLSESEAAEVEREVKPVAKETLVETPPQPDPQTFAKRGKKLNDHSILSILSANSQGNFYLDPNIPPQKLTNASKSCHIPHSEKILGLIDCGIRFGFARGCVLFGREAVYYRNWSNPPDTIRYGDLSECWFMVNSSYVLFVSSLKNRNIDTNHSGVTAETLLEILEAIKKLV